MKKRLTATLLSLCLLLTLLPAPVFAAGAADSGIPSAQSMVTQQNNAGGYSMATPSDVQPEECTCETLCTGDNINADCPVCSVEGAELDKVCVGVAPMLPATARAITPRIAYDTLRIGNTLITGSGYWTTDGNGNLTASDAGNYNVAFDADTNTLSLNNATIVGSYDANNNPEGTGIYAGSRFGAVSLTIQVTGNNVVSGSIGIYALSNGGEVSVTISGGGSLTASGSQNGIGIVSEFSNAALAIEGTAVKASGSYSGGVWVQAGESSTGSLSVDGGSLTASGNTGIYFPFSTGVSGSGIPSLTVAGNAVVDAKSGGIAHNSSNNLSIQGNSGMVFNGSTGTVYGNASLQDDLIIGEGERLILDNGANLDANGHNVIVDGGTLDEGIKNSLGDSVKYTPTITTESLSNGTVGETYNQTLAATGTTPITWSITDGSLPTGLTLNESTGEISGTPTAAGTSTFTVTATNTVGSDNSVATDSKELSITINEPATVSVTGVTLSQTKLSLTEGDTAQLTATVKPDNATNKAVTWSSDNETVATVNNGLVTAMKAGTATITVAATDGSGVSATCTVTINAATTITTQPQSVSVTEGQSATFNVTASGGNLRYQWQINSGNGWSAITGATDASYTIDRTTTAMGGNQYRCVVTGDGGTVTSDAATLTVRSYDPPYTGKYSYEIVSDVGENGTIDVDRYATEGDQVTITVSPDEAYLLDDLTVTSGGRDVALTDNSDGTYTFTMPSGDVAITATFAEDPNWEEPEDPATDVSEIFTDVPANHWAKAAIQYVYDNGLMTGVSDSEFAPEATTTRAMIVSMLARMENVTSAADAGFTDVTASDWYATAVNWAAANGIVSGIGDNTFAPNDPITREQLAAMLMKYAQYKGLDTTARADLSHYSDAASISSWANDVLSWAVAEGLLAGVTDDQLQPQGQATRAQVAAIMQRFLENVCA